MRDDYERVKRAIADGQRRGLSPLRAVAAMANRPANIGELLRRWLDERREEPTDV